MTCVYVTMRSLYMASGESFSGSPHSSREMRQEFYLNRETIYIHIIYIKIRMKEILLRCAQPFDICLSMLAYKITDHTYINIELFELNNLSHV